MSVIKFVVQLIANVTVIINPVKDKCLAGPMWMYTTRLHHFVIKIIIRRIPINLLMDINIMTWNATGIMSSSSYLSDCFLSKNIDICGLSEHWLYEKDLIFLNQINSNYNCHAVSISISDSQGAVALGKAGRALLWHKRLDSIITPLSFEDDRIIGIQIEISPSFYVYVFQTYFLCSNHPIAEFLGYIDKLENLLGLYADKGLVVIMGNLNANLLHSQSVSMQNNRSPALTDFLSRNNMVSVNTLELCTGARSSFVS